MFCTRRILQNKICSFQNLHCRWLELEHKTMEFFLAFILYNKIHNEILISSKYSLIFTCVCLQMHHASTSFLLILKNELYFRLDLIDHLTSINLGDILLLYIQFLALQRIAWVIVLHISNPQLKQHAKLTLNSRILHKMILGKHFP